MCFSIYRRLNTLNKCALMRLEISPQRKRVSLSAHAHTWTPLFMNPFAHLLNYSSVCSSQPPVHSWPQGKAVFSLILFNEKAPVGFISVWSGSWGPWGKKDSFNVLMKGLHSPGTPPTEGMVPIFLKYFLILLAHHKELVALTEQSTKHVFFVIIHVRLFEYVPYDLFYVIFMT